MIKAELRSLIAGLVPRFEETVRYHPRFLDAAIEKALSEFYNLIFLRNPLELQLYTKQFGYTVPITINLEAGTGLRYANYPLMADGVTNVTTISIPDKASGCRRISTIAQGGITFYPIDAREMDLLGEGCYTDTITAKIGYCARRDRIEFYNMSAAVIASGCRMDLLVPFSKYEETDTVLVPELTGDEGMGFTDRVLKILEGVKPLELLENKQLEENK
jgi:hypothetical protein